MYNENIWFSSDREYRSIIKSGKYQFSMTQPSSFTLTDVNGDEEFLVFCEVNGYRGLSADYSGYQITPYIENGYLKAFIEEYASISGYIYWRVYGNKS